MDIMYEDKNSDNFSFIYTCDIEDVEFRIKIGNLDGILPSSAVQNSQLPINPATKQPTSVQNNFSYNIVEVLNELDLIDELASDDESLDASQSEESNTEPFYVSQLAKMKKKQLDKEQNAQELNKIIYGSSTQPSRTLSSHPIITCDLVSNGQRLCPPQQTQYKHMGRRYEWNEWLPFSLTLDTLPRDARVCFTVWDTIGPGKMAAVARTSISLFSKYGLFRKGIYDLRLFFNDDLKEYLLKSEEFCKRKQKRSNTATSDISITLADLDFQHRDHANKELLIPEAQYKLHSERDEVENNNANHLRYSRWNSKPANDLNSANELFFTSKAQYLQSDLCLYPDGNCDLSEKVKRLNKLKKKYYNGHIQKIAWLDQLTFLNIEHIIVEEKALSTLVFLTVEFPEVLIENSEVNVVYFEDKEDHGCQYDLVEKEIVKIQDPELHLENLVELKHHKLVRSARSGISDRDLKPNSTIRNQLTAIVNCPPTKPLTNEEQDLVWKFRFWLSNQKKALTKFLKTVNWNAATEVEQAIDLIEQWTPMDVDDALELLSPQFRHPYVRRYAVSRIRKADDDDLLLYLLQLVQALKYENFDDIKQSYLNEIQQYSCQNQDQQNRNEHKSHSSTGQSEQAGSDSPDTRTGRIPSSNSESDCNSLTQKYPEDLATFLINRACSNDSLANYFFWYLSVECEGERNIGGHHPATASDRQLASLSNTNSVIMSSAITSSYLVPAPPLFGPDTDSKMSSFAGVKRSDSSGSSTQDTINGMYSIMLKRFSDKLLNGTPEMVARREFLDRQGKFVRTLVEIMKEVARESGNRTKKIEKLQSVLASSEPIFRFDFSPQNPLPLPLNPDVKIVSVMPKEATLFKSAMMPAKLGFCTSDGSAYYMIFKHGDDLRQDDLVLQMIILMDKLLRMENLDLKLTPYRVLACSAKHGFVQFVESQSVHDVLSIEGSIQNYLKKISSENKHRSETRLTSVGSSQSLDASQSLNPGTGDSGSNSSSPINQPTNLPSISAEVMDAYIKSFAGYCVITYLLGVGDRHLDNLMLTQTGRLFHIDFGFILGRDPKVRPPPMKITREMVDAMGGMNSENFSKFYTLVRTAFLHLRRHANLILNLFSLMIDANVPDIALEPDKTVQKVQDKFKLELNDEQAVHYISEQVEQSVRSIMPVVVDQFHKMAQYLRN